MAAVDTATATAVASWLPPTPWSPRSPPAVQRRCHLPWRTSTTFLPSLDEKQRRLPVAGLRPIVGVMQSEEDGNGSPAETVGAVSGKDGSAAAVGSAHLLLDLDLQNGDLDLYADDIDRDGEDFDHGYRDDSPPSSAALCAKSCSCDSCVNISRSISLEFSKGSEHDLAGSDSTDQRVSNSIEACRHYCHRSSDSAYRPSVSLPRYAKFRTRINENRWMPSFRAAGGRAKAGAGPRVRGIRRAPRFVRSHSRTESSEHTTAQVSAPSRETMSPAAQPENVYLFDHMMSCGAAISEPPSPPPPAHSTPPPLENPNLATPLENASPLNPNQTAETQRTVSFNTPHPVTSYVSAPLHGNSSPRVSETSLASPRNSLPLSAPNVIPTPAPRPSLTHSQQSSSYRLSSSRTPSQMDLKNISAALKGVHRGYSIDLTIDNNLRAIASSRDIESEVNDVRCRSNKSSKSSIPVSSSLSRTQSNLKFSDGLHRRSESNSVQDTTEKSQERTKSQKKACFALGGLPTQIGMSEQVTTNDGSGLGGRKISVKGRGQSSVEENPGFIRVQKNRQGSGKERTKENGLPTRRDVRHPPDSGFASSASSTLSPSPRGQANVHHYIKKRSERSGTDRTAQAHINQRSSSTSNNTVFKESEIKSHNAAIKLHDSIKVPIPETIKEVGETKEDHPKNQSNSNWKTVQTSVGRMLPPPPPPPPTPPQNEPKYGGARPSSNRNCLRKHSSTPNANTPKYSSSSTRIQLEKDFHNLLESLGFVCHTNEPGNTADCNISKQRNSTSLQQNPSLYSIPKANFLASAKPRRGSESMSMSTTMTIPAPTPSVLLSDDPDDPRRRPDLKAARHYLDNPVLPPKSVYRSELFAKVEANKVRPQRVEPKKLSETVIDKPNSKPTEQASDARKTPSQTSITRKKSKPVVSNQKPINVEQIRSIKQTVDNAIADGKIFVIYGAFPSIRDALKSRGWIEKRPYPDKKTPTENDPAASRNRGSRELFQHGNVGVQTLQSADPSVVALIESMSTNPNEIDFEEELTERAIVSRMLRNVDPNFIWTVKCEAMDWKRLKKKQIINRFPRAFFSTKIGLSTFLRQMHWFSEEGISMTRFPRCYNICQADDMEAFVEDFRLTACLGVLKMVIERFGRMGDSGVQDDSGKVPKYALEFAIARCGEYLVQNNHADLDQSAPPVVNCHQWDQFLAWSYELRSDNGRFSKLCAEPTPQVMSETARDVIRRMSEVWPQMELDGYLNIWILKPGAKSRGRGIHLINRLDAVTEHVSPQHIRDARYVAQKYIERPLIIFGTKFDIRQWFLVTSVYPMTIWMYRESYLRFCSQSFSLTNMHESVHLCNNAVQAKYKNGKRDPALPDENMWDCYTFQTYLRALGRPELWDTVIYPGMRQGIIGTLLASQEHMDRRTDCFELFGADFMLTEDFNPWLIEINSCPCMAPSTSVTARMCAQCLEDVIKVVIDRQNDRNADTGRFELVYKQHIPPPPPYIGMNLSVKGRRVHNGSGTNTSAGVESSGPSLQQVNRRTRRPASDPTKRRQRHPRIVLPSTEGPSRYQLKDKLSNDSVTTLQANESSCSESETDTPTSADSESRPPRTPTPTCPPSRLESLRFTSRPSVVAAMVAKQKTKRAQSNVLAAVGHGVIQPSEDNHKKSMELLREWRQRARTSGLISRSSPSKLGSLSSAHSAEMMRRMSSSSNGSSLMAVGVTLNGLMR